MLLGRQPDSTLQTIYIIIITKRKEGSQQELRQKTNRFRVHRAQRLFWYSSKCLLRNRMWFRRQRRMRAIESKPSSSSCEHPTPNVEFSFQFQQPSPRGHDVFLRGAPFRSKDRRISRRSVKSRCITSMSNKTLEQL